MLVLTHCCSGDTVEKLVDGRPQPKVVHQSIRDPRHDLIVALRKLRETALQAFLCLAAYAGSHLFTYVCPNLEVAGRRNPFWTILMQNLLFPLQGFFNVLVFLRPRLLAIQKNSLNMPSFKAVYAGNFHYEKINDGPRWQLVLPDCHLETVDRCR